MFLALRTGGTRILFCAGATRTEISEEFRHGRCAGSGKSSGGSRHLVDDLHRYRFDRAALCSRPHVWQQNTSATCCLTTGRRHAGPKRRPRRCPRPTAPSLPPRRLPDLRRCVLAIRPSPPLAGTRCICKMPLHVQVFGCAQVDVPKVSLLRGHSLGESLPVRGHFPPSEVALCDRD